MNTNDTTMDRAEAIREIEQIEDELKQRGIDDLRERLTDARATLVESSLESQLSNMTVRGSVDENAAGEEYVSASINWDAEHPEDVVRVVCGCGTEQTASLGDRIECEGCGSPIQIRR